VAPFWLARFGHTSVGRLLLGIATLASGAVWLGIAIH